MPYKDPEARRQATKKSWDNWRQRNPEKAKESYQKWRRGKSGRDYYLWWSAKRRSKRDGVEFTITRADIPPTPDICPIALIPIKFRDDNGKGPSNHSPSLDRIDPHKGYTPENIRVISHKGNRWKGDMTRDDVQRVLDYMDSKDLTKEVIMTDQKDFDKEFVALWMRAIKEDRNSGWVAEQLHVNKNYALNKAQTLRRRGVKLPSMRGGRYSVSPEHVADLNNLIEGGGKVP